MGVVGTTKSILAQNLSNKSHYAMVDGCRNKLENVVQCFGLQLFFQYTSELFSILKNKLVCFADDSTFVDVVLSPNVEGISTSGTMQDHGNWGRFG